MDIKINIEIVLKKTNRGVVDVSIITTSDVLDMETKVSLSRSDCKVMSVNVVIKNNKTELSESYLAKNVKKSIIEFVETDGDWSYLDGIEAYILDALKNEEEKRFEFVEINAEKKLLYRRFENKNKLYEFLVREFDVLGELDETSDSGEISDYSYLVGINKEWGYMDIYFLKSPGDGSIFITEVNISDE